MKKGILTIITILSLVILSGCVINEEPKEKEEEEIVNEYIGIPKQINIDAVTSYSYAFTYFEEIDIKMTADGNGKITVGNRTVYTLKDESIYHIIYETNDNEFISVEEEDESYFMFNISGIMDDLYENYPLDDFVQVELTNTFEYKEEDTVVTIKVNKDMEIIELRVFSNSQVGNLFRIYDINSTEFTFPEFVFTSKSEYIMDKYFDDFAHLFANDEITITENNVNAIIDDRGDIEIITDNKTYTIRDTDDIIVMDDNYNSYSKEEFLELEPNISESLFDKIIEIAYKLEHFDNLLKTDE